MDKRTRRAIDAALAGFTDDREGRHYIDRSAPAVYRLEPPGWECAALACLACRTVTIKPGAPRRARETMACNNCGQLWQLEPPPEVVAFGATGIRVVGIDAPTTRLS